MNLIMPFHPLKQSWYGWFSPFESTMHVLMTNIFLVTPTLAGISEDFGRCLCVRLWAKSLNHARYTHKTTQRFI